MGLKGATMIRNTLVPVLSVLMLVLVGCAKSSEPPQRAETAKGGLMPAEEPGFEAAYVADQKEVKLATAREVSYDALSTFREKNAEAAKAKEAAEAGRKIRKFEPAEKAEKGDKAQQEPKAAKRTDKPAAKAKVAKKAPGSGKPGLLGRMKDAALGKLAPGLMQGGGDKPAKVAPAKKETEKKKEKAKAEDEEEGEDKEEAEE